MDNERTLGPWLTTRVLNEAEQMARESIEGQAIELGWRYDNALDLDDTDYLQMVLKKTCWYTTIYPSRVGALIGLRRELAADAFLRFGFFLGAAFQIQDDILNLQGNEARYGKELGGDIREGKRTLMLVHLLRVASPGERARLAEFLARPRAARTAADIGWIADRMLAYRCIDHAREVAHGLAGAALHEYAVLYAGLPDSRDKRFIEGLVTWVLNRA
jgi:geranylgeranyl diphosphate synthase type II